MTPKQTNTLREEIREILVEYKKDYGGNDFGLDKADKALSALFQKVVDKAENRIELVGGMGIKASMGVALTADEWIEIKGYFKDIVEGKETI